MFHLNFFLKIFLDTQIKRTSAGIWIACYGHINHLLAFTDVFLERFTVFAWGEIAQLVITGRGDCTIDPFYLFTSEQ